MFLKAGELKEQDKSTPRMQAKLSNAGLFIKSRSGQLTRVAIPNDCLAFQLGEAAQILSKQQLIATPHLVKGIPGFCRNTFAVFLQPDVEYELEEGLSFSKFTEEVMERHY